MTLSYPTCWPLICILRRWLARQRPRDFRSISSHLISLKAVRGKVIQSSSKQALRVSEYLLVLEEPPPLSDFLSMGEHAPCRLWICSWAYRIAALALEASLEESMWNTATTSHPLEEIWLIISYWACKWRVVTILHRNRNPSPLRWWKFRYPVRL